MRPISPTKDERQRSQRRHLIGLAALVALTVLLAAMTATMFNAAGERRVAEAAHLHALKVLVAAGDTRTAINEALRGTGGYLLTHDAAFVEAYRKGAADAPRLAAELRALTGQNPRQRSNLDALDASLSHFLAVLKDSLRFEQQGRSDEAASLIRLDVGEHDLDSLLEVITRIEGEERRTLNARETSNQHAVERLEARQIALSALAVLCLAASSGAGLAAVRARKHELAAQDRLHRAAHCDDLTGLANRRALFSALDEEVAKAGASGTPLSLAIIDLDFFKAVNDGLGHQAGDSVLRSVSAAMREMARATDYVGRLGGEEFGIVMPGTDHAAAALAAERIRQGIASARTIVANGTEAPMTASIGVAQIQPGESRDALMARADAALYRAKEEGRNRIKLAA